MGYVPTSTAVATRERRVARLAPQLGALPIAAAAGLARGLLRRRRGPPPKITARDFIDWLAQQGDVVVLREIATTGQGPASEAYVACEPGERGCVQGKTRHRFSAAEQAQARAHVERMTGGATAVAPMTAPRLIAAPATDTTPPVLLAPPPLTVPATITTPGAPPVPVSATIGTRPRPSGLPSRPTSPLIQPPATPPLAPTAPSDPADSTINQLLRAFAQAVPQAAPIVSAIAPAAVPPVNVTVTAPAGAPAADAGAAGFFDRYKVPLAIGAAGLVALVVLPRVLGGARRNPHRRRRRRR